MPNRQIVNNQPTNVEVQIYGQDPKQSVNIDNQGRVAVTGVISVTTLGPLSITGVVIGNLTVLNTPSITIVGIPNISITGTAVISGTARIEGTPTIQIGGHGFTQINQSFNAPSLALLGTTINTPAINISNLNNFSYYVQTPSGLLSLLTINSQLSPDGTNFVTGDSFNSTNLSLLGINLDLGGNLTTNKYLFYSRLQFSMVLGVFSGGPVTVIFMGQY